MNVRTVSALALLATTLTAPAFAADPATPAAKPAAPAALAPVKGQVPPKPKAPKAPKAAEPQAAEAPAEASPPAEEAAPAEGDSLLPSDHREPPPPADRPLVLRRTADKPLELSSGSSTDGLWVKLAACGLIVGGAVWALRKRGLLTPPPKAHPMTILGRTSIGVRSELLLVDVDGQKLLLGVTPSSISRLAVLPVHGDAPSLADELVDPAEPADQEPGFDHALASARATLEDFAARMKTRPPVDAPVGRSRETIAPREPSPARESHPTREPSRASRHATPRPSVAERLEDERPSREVPRATSRESIAERELRDLRASRPDLRSRPDLGEQAQSLLRLRQARGRG